MISSTADRQLEIIGGIGAVCDEMAIDFDMYFTESYGRYFQNGLLTADQIDLLKELDVFLEARSSNKSPEFWDDVLLSTNPEWEIVRQKAKMILECLGMRDLTIAFDRAEKYEITEQGKQLTMVSTKTRLVRT
jgi:hypothetical protein